MNYPVWYYYSINDRSPSWTGVDYFYDFMTTNEGIGPFAEEIGADGGEIGDVIQLGRNDDGFYHTLLLVGYDGDDPIVAAQTDDAYARPLSTYTYDFSRFLKIKGVRIEIADQPDCFSSVISGSSLSGGGGVAPTPPGTGGGTAQSTPPATDGGGASEMQSEPTQPAAPPAAE